MVPCPRMAEERVPWPQGVAAEQPLLLVAQASLPVRASAIAWWFAVSLCSDHSIVQVLNDVAFLLGIVIHSCVPNYLMGCPAKRFSHFEW